MSCLNVTSRRVNFCTICSMSRLHGFICITRDGTDTEYPSYLAHNFVKHNVACMGPTVPEVILEGHSYLTIDIY